MENKKSDKVREVYKKMLQSSRNNETPYEAIMRFMRIFYDTVVHRKNPNEQKQK